MHFTKPSWVVHKDSSKEHNAKRLSIFSVHVHPDGSRIATGGLDAKIRIWSTKPILNPASEESGKPPKSLCTLTMHTGPVLVVRWAHSGRWLASGSDDAIVMIWDLDPHARGRVWGTDEINVEGWKPLKRLPGHDSDVTDLAWSPGDRYLASVGLDSTVIIWCGYTLESLRKLDAHQGFVKGVCWDPVGEFLATQSDDRTVKIWRTADWSLEAEISKPFVDSPGSTFFRRLSWSPDGAHITASNATNNSGLVFIAAVITRNLWTSEISLVGHENTVEVAAYNPHIFLRNPDSPVATSNICSVVALGADDRSVSVWQTKSARPLIVAKEVFERQIMDLSWSWDGLTLYAASSDGTLAVFNFEPKELEGIAPHSVQQQYLAKYNFTPTPVPGGFSHTPPPQTSTRMTPPPSPSANARASPSTSFAAGNPSATTTNEAGEKVHVLVAKRGKNKKRVGLLQPPVPSASAPNSSAGGNALRNNFQRAALSTHGFPIPDEQPFKPESSWTHGMGMEIDHVPIDAIDTSIAGNSNGRKRKGDVAGMDEDSRVAKARTLGGDRVRESVTAVRELRPGVTAPRLVVSAAPMIGSSNGINLPVLPVLNYMKDEMEGSDEVLEVKNSEDGDPTEVALVNGKQTLFLDYLPHPALAARTTRSFCAVATADGSLHIYSPTGRRLIPTLCLGAPCSIIDAKKDSLLVITAAGQMYCWNIKKQSVHFPPVSLSTILPQDSPNQTISSALIRPNGSPVLTCTNGIVYSYDPALSCFIKLSDKWWAEGSEIWVGRQPRSSTARGDNGRGVVANIESSISSAMDAALTLTASSSSSAPNSSSNGNGVENGPASSPAHATAGGGGGGGAGVTGLLSESFRDKPKSEWWGPAMTLGHLETRLHATRLLESPTEYKQAMTMYAKRLADEGFRGKAEELIKELFGPVYWRPGREDTTNGWSPTAAGLSKRDLLRDILTIFARSKTLTKLALDWQDILKKAVNDD